MARAMKDSGIEWIGEIPAGWTVTKVLNGLSMPITDGPHTTPELFEDGIVFISAEAVSCGNGKIDFSHKRGYISNDFYLECCKKYIPKIDDIYMIKSGATTGRVAIVDTLEPIFTIWSPLAVFRCNDAILVPKFLFYQLQAEGFQKQVEFAWSFGTQQNIGMRSLEQLKIILPALSEQARIADFLDVECARIDTVIEQTRASIEEYKKLKQSVITQAVTKGIRPDRKMKDSGVEWIGEIASLFYVFRLKHLLRAPLQYGANESGILYENNLPRYIRITDISLDGMLRASGALSLTEETAKGYILSNNDILFARSGATVGKAFIYKTEYGRAAFAGYLIRATVNEKIEPEFLFLYTQSSIYEEWKKQIFVQATIQNISADRYSELPVVLPPIEEQQEVIRYLNDRLREIDRLIERKEKLLTEIETYRKSLIFEYVTGKREVK